MKKNILSYTAPDVEIYEVAVESGYGNSTLLPSFGSEEDDSPFLLLAIGHWLFFHKGY